MPDEVLKFDELNSIRTAVEYEVLAGQLPEIKFDKKRTEDFIFELLTMAYAFGLEKASDELGISIPLNETLMRDTVMAETAGETFVDRLNKHIDAANASLSADPTQLMTAAATLINELAVLAETEAHRVLNTAILDGADYYKAKNPDAQVSKTWITMEDDRVRDTHFYIHGVTIPTDAKFYTYDGDSAMRPGGFTLPQNNVNCRCTLELRAH